MHIVKEYSSPAGTVRMLQGRVYFVVQVQSMTAPGVYRIKETGRLSYEDAVAKYSGAKDVLDGIVPAKTYCKYNPARVRLCNSRNCPKQLGGAAFYQIFGNSCLHKTR